MSASVPSEPPADLAQRPQLFAETMIVLGVSLGSSGIYALLSIIDSLTRPQPLNQQTTSMNNSVTPDRPWLDLAYQAANIVLPLVPVLLAIYLLNRVSRPVLSATATMGFDGRQPLRDSGRAALLAALIGIPGIAFYLLARQIGINTNVQPANLAANWWTIPVYLLRAAMNGILEEVIMVGYLFTRWSQLNWRPLKIILVSALIRGSYHLYQGFGGFLGNVVMGIAFGWFYTRTRRVLPLVIAHTLMDVVVFVGYPLAKARFPGI